MNQYNEILDLINNVDNLVDLLLDAVSQEQEVKIIDENGETSYSYSDFINIFDQKGLMAFC